MLCMEDRNKAFETASNMGMNYYSTLAYHWLDNVPAAQGPARVARTRSPSPRPSRSSSCRPRATSPSATPTTAPARCSAGSTSASTSSRSAPPPTRCPPRSSSASMELFGREVIPQFDTDPEHSTTRYRREAAAKLTADTPGAPALRPGPDRPTTRGGTAVGAPDSFNMADLWEMAADAVPEREALVVGDQRRTYAELEERANRLAHHLAGRGVGRRRPRRRSTSRTAPSTSRPCSPRSSCGPCRSTSTTATWPTSCATCSTTATRSGVITQPSLAATVAAVVPDVPAVRLHPRRPASDYEAALAAASAERPVVAEPQRRRPLRHLHRRHDRHAEGRRVAPGGRLLRLHRRRRPDAAARSGRATRRAARPHRRQPGLLPADRAADARRRPVDVALVAVRRRQGRAHARLARRRRRVAGRSPTRR